ncbi:Endoglucanase [Thalictrum thalictroides]|uniref:cellulase n=1 Tax=Thalictrum thalictroides TaxID=46969 RepID=A0A7J6X337_THATH|nr:Endoglucanase [Thalictrum thalictroides]
MTSYFATEVVAAFAASAITFKNSNPTYSSLLLTHAQQLFEFVKNHHRHYSDSVPDVKTFYESRDEQDELLWAALWLLRATSNTSYYGGYVDAYSGTGWIRSGVVTPDELIAYAKSQVEYILGANPKGMSFMVGYGLD